MTDILKKILEQKKIEVARLDKKVLRTKAENAAPPQNFKNAIRRDSSKDSVKLIAELKRASPSKGLIAPNLDLCKISHLYENNGAAAISVLTDEMFFQGSLETLTELKQNEKIKIPLLRKDFMIDETQLFEAVIHGADSILLIVAALDQFKIQELHDCALELGLIPLVEVHDEDELERAMAINGLQMIGINNRNLKTFQVSLETTKRLIPYVPQEIVKVAESGIFTADDVVEVAEAGVDAILVGEGIISSIDIPSKVRELSSIRVNS